jgi:hypothetical protein
MFKRKGLPSFQHNWAFSFYYNCWYDYLLPNLRIAELSCVVTVLEELAKLWGKSDQQDLTSFKGRKAHKTCWTVREVSRTILDEPVSEVKSTIFVKLRGKSTNKTSRWRTRGLLRVAARRYWSLRAGLSTIGSPGTVPVSLSVGAWCVLWIVLAL